MKIKALLLFTLAAFMLPSISSAKPKDRDGEAGSPQHGKGNPAEMFQKTDTNKDGGLSLEEVEKARAKRLIKHFSKIDADSNGLLTQKELKARHEAMKGQRAEGKGKKGKKEKRSVENEEEDSE